VANLRIEMIGGSGLGGGEQARNLSDSNASGYPLKFANAESLGWAVACALHRRARPLRVAWFRGEGADKTIETFGERGEDEGGDYALYADYVPPVRSEQNA